MSSVSTPTFVATTLVCVVVAVLMMTLVELLRRKDKLIANLASRVYRHPDPEQSVELYIPLGRFYLVKARRELPREGETPVIYVYLPENFGYSEETLSEIDRLLRANTDPQLGLTKLGPRDPSGANGYIAVRGIQPGAEVQLERVARLLREKVVYPKGVTTLSTPDR